MKTKKRNVIRHVRRLTADQLISEISETLAEADGEYLAKLANQVLSGQVKYSPRGHPCDGAFSITSFEEKPKKEKLDPKTTCPGCKRGLATCSCIPVGDEQQ